MHESRFCQSECIGGLMLQYTMGKKMVPYTIREAGADDLTAIAAIYGASVIEETASFELEAPDEAEMARRYEALVAENYPYFVLEVEGRVVGFAYGGPYHIRPAYRYTVESSIYLDWSVRGQGLSAPLLEVLIKACADRGYRQMIAVIGGSQRFASIRAHEKVGFQQVGTVHSVGYKFDEWLNCLILQRALGEGSSTKP